ncbi:HNH endonuclease [Pseudonocardia alni]|uniref:HNH endonuclease n=1 Tax=Pseudonocardia alni TaxID=33907 RepID=UPI003723F06E
MRNWHSAARQKAGSRAKRYGHLNYVHRQRTLVKGNLSPGVTHAEWLSLLQSYGGLCAYCGSCEKIEQDHVIPVSRDGLHAPDNVLPACRSCNVSKGDKLLREWMPDWRRVRGT